MFKQSKHHVKLYVYVYISWLRNLSGSHYYYYYFIVIIIIIIIKNINNHYHYYLTSVKPLPLPSTLIVTGVKFTIFFAEHRGQE